MTEATTYRPEGCYTLEDAAEMGAAAFQEGSERALNPFPAGATVAPVKWFHDVWNAGWDAARDLADPVKQAAELEELHATLRAEG